MRIIFHLILVFFFGGLPFSFLSAQNVDPSASTIQNQYWLEFEPHHEFSDKLEYYGSMGYRNRDHGKHQVLMARPSLKWQATPVFSVHGGVGLYYNIYEDADDLFEFRTWEGVRLGWPDLGPLKFKHYLRYEQRYYTQFDSLNFRWRYRIGAKLPFNNKYIQKGSVYLPFSYEVLSTSSTDFKKNWVSQSRLQVGIGYIFSTGFQVELDYQAWWTKPLPEDILNQDQNVFRLVIHLNGWILGE